MATASGAWAQAAPITLATSGQQARQARHFKLAAAVELSLAAAFAGAGTALVVTRPSDFSAGIGLGHLMWSPGLLLEGIFNAVSARHVQRRGPPLFGNATLRSRRWDVALAAVTTALGAALFGLGAIGEGRDVAYGVGAVYVTYGSGLLAYTAYQLACAKRGAARARAAPRH